jgi:serine/threonine-protein kinase SRPK3
MGSYLDNELNIYRRINAGPKSHPGYGAVRTLIDSFHVDGPDGKHQCLVHPPLLESVLTYLHRSPVKRLPAADVAFILKRLFLALDFLHTECQVIHTGQCSEPILLYLSVMLRDVPTRHQSSQYYVQHRRRVCIH